jgi:uncharacterized protein (DUF433 family)
VNSAPEAVGTLGKRYLTARYSSRSVKLAWLESWRMRVVLGEDGALGRAGRPCIRGLRISVYDVLAMLSNGMSQDEVLEDFPELTRDDIMAALAYAADREHRVYSLKVQ